MIACVTVDIICGILLAFVSTREVGVSSRNVVSRTFPHFSQSMLTPMETSVDVLLPTSVTESPSQIRHALSVLQWFVG